MAQTLFGIKERIRNTGMKMASVLHALIINFLFTMSNHYTEKETLFLYVTSHGVNIKRQLQNKKYRGLIIIMMMMMMMIIIIIIIIIKEPLFWPIEGKEGSRKLRLPDFMTVGS